MFLGLKRILQVDEVEWKWNILLVFGGIRDKTILFREFNPLPLLLPHFQYPLQVSVLNACFKINFDKGLLIRRVLIPKFIGKTMRKKMPCYKMVEICLLLSFLFFKKIKVTIRNDFILMLLDWVFLSFSIPKKAVVSFLLLKLKVI